MKLTDPVVSDLLGSLYDAAAAPELWPPFLTRLEKLMGAAQAGLLLHDAAYTDHTIAAQVDMDPDYRRAYIEHYAKTDIWYQRGREVAYPGWVGPSQALVPDTKLVKSEFYNDLLRRYGVFNQIGVVLEHENDRMFVVTLLRSKKAGAFGDSHVQLLRFLVPHLRRAFQLHRQMTDLRLRSAGLRWALDSWPTGVVLLDATGRVLLLNRAASQVLERRDGLFLGRDGLTAARPADTQRLGKLIRAALRTANGSGFHPAGALHLQRASSDRPLTVLVSPFRMEGMVFPMRPVVAVFVNDPDTRVRPRGDVLRELYGLTPAESALATLLAEGKTLQEAAGLRGVTHQTARSQLKSIFSKTATRRQSELLRLLLSLPAGWPRPPFGG
jgi:DNA-binding CsgD family transcriptional regulator/PAS domain-containing protein